MESVQVSQHQNDRQLMALAEAMEAIKPKEANSLPNVKELFDYIPPKKESPLDKAKELAASVAKAAKELDQSVEKIGLFFEEVLIDDKLQTEQISRELAEKGGLPIEEFPLAIPQIDEQTLDRFVMSSQIIIHELPSKLREEAMFLMSLCNQLLFQRELLEKDLFASRKSRRDLLVQYLKDMNRKENPHTNMRRFG